MSIRARLITSLVLIGLVPTVAFIYVVNHSLSDLNNLILETNQTVISQIPLEISQPLVNINNQVASKTNLVTTQLYLVGGIIVILAIILGVILGSGISKPILNMVKTAEQATQGYLEAFQPSDDPSELGALSRSIYTMTIQLTEGMDNLEQQAAERTRELSRRSEQLEVASQIGREVSTILNVNRLLDELTHLISERFGYYHVSIFLIDDTGEYAVLRAANSTGGKNLLAHGYKLSVVESSIVGYVAQYGKARVAFDVESDPTLVRNSELPETRSEAAIPLRIGDRVIGVLDVQSIALSAFSVDDMRVLQIVADQVALAMENTRLFAENKAVIRELEQAIGKQVEVSWRRRLRNTPVTYKFNRMGVEPADPFEFNGKVNQAVSNPTLSLEQHELIVPLSVREIVIGSIILRREPDSDPWTQDDLLLVQDVMEQIGPALESARFLEETQALAMREQTINMISTQVRRSAGMDAILQKTVQELGKVLGSSRTFIQLGIEAPIETNVDEREDLGE